MIIDMSAILAILRAEPQARACAEAFDRSTVRGISAGTLMETAVVIDSSRDRVARRRLDDLLQAANISVEPVTKEQAQIGRDAYRDFGKVSGHPAQLNFGDCFSYAPARAVVEPLLFKGGDFAHTDVAPALGGAAE